MRLHHLAHQVDIGGIGDPQHDAVRRTVGFHRRRSCVGRRFFSRFFAHRELLLDPLRAAPLKARVQSPDKLAHRSLILVGQIPKLYAKGICRRMMNHGR